jgi:hypothetical protein
MAHHDNTAGNNQASNTPQPPTTLISEAKHFHKIHVKVPYDRSGMEHYSPSLLYTVMERLTEGEEIFDGITNKEWLASHFDGGMHISAVEQPVPEQSFIVHYFLVLFSSDRMMSKEVKKGITARFQTIVPTGSIHFVRPSRKPIQDHYEVGNAIIALMLKETRVYPESEIYQNMGPEF